MLTATTWFALLNPSWLLPPIYEERHQHLDDAQYERCTFVAVGLKLAVGALAADMMLSCARLRRSAYLLGRLVKIVTFIDAVFVLIWIFFSPMFMMGLLLLLVGYLGARAYNACMT